MHLILVLKAAFMGVVEGLTEFLPISSTGHLILAGSLIDWTGDGAKAFEIIIQAGAILAVCWEFRGRIAKVMVGLGNDPAARRFVFNLAIAFVPAAVIGVVFGAAIKAVLFAPVPVALAFVVGGFVILLTERSLAGATRARVQEVEDVTPLDALKIGLAQTFALIPGTSRSGATIIGGMLFGLSRKVATEFSFFLAIPTIFAATFYSLYKERAALAALDSSLLVVGLVTSFLSAFLCVRWLLRYISTHDFRAFAWYRIAFGLVILLTAHFGWVAWAD
ncbi:MAG TPA: undecaprenyl-diphosphate phosphatase [Candidatus Binatia bacterium]|jgi:undecaprenyl-diphosphatase